MLRETLDQIDKNAEDTIKKKNKVAADVIGSFFLLISKFNLINFELIKIECVSINRRRCC